MFMFERPVGTNARPQGRHPLLARARAFSVVQKPRGAGGGW